MKLPIMIARADSARAYHKHVSTHKRIWCYAKPIYTTTMVGTNQATMTGDYSPCKYQVLLANWIYFLPSLPEMAWRHVLCRLWLDRLTFQYEAGYAAGLKDGLANTHAHDGLTPEEREALTS